MVRRRIDRAVSGARTVAVISLSVASLLLADPSGAGAATVPAVFVGVLALVACLLFPSSLFRRGSGDDASNDP